MYNLDAIFSEYIRKRDAVNGHVKCITCGGIFHWKDVDCGHYISRKYNSTRYNEINCNAQCRACNRFKGVREEEYHEQCRQFAAEYLNIEIPLPNEKLELKF